MYFLFLNHTDIDTLLNMNSLHGLLSSEHSCTSLLQESMLDFAGDFDIKIQEYA